MSCSLESYEKPSQKILETPNMRGHGQGGDGSVERYFQMPSAALCGSKTPTSIADNAPFHEFFDNDAKTLKEV